MDQHHRIAPVVFELGDENRRVRSKPDTYISVSLAKEGKNESAMLKILELRQFLYQIGNGYDPYREWLKSST
ncbi:uncharacterized protein PHALS_11629 [Plasmopara halstedii]|uniref:Uncharacterized protein n=1 Tax=Plasmopara halstedii TaxID=4781 RepID=A0A0P1AJM9_PLAHL|nr:uncharacterized protein PHALS_11629 [Plasmopara halstedii]CEG41271.1 hypothetical protein PHALS_11629 [Plasmopara halstedii]|eukprot:XP_024577640.1 hypothetical protein PHALS_11629 [Plasmopara halstedii]